MGPAARATRGAVASATRTAAKDRATRRNRTRELRAWCTAPLSRPAPRAACHPDAGLPRKVASAVSSRGSSAVARYTLSHPAAHRAAQARRTQSRSPWRSRARDPRVPCAALQPRDGARSRPRDRAAVRRDLARAADGASSARPAQRRRDRPAGGCRRGRSGREVSAVRTDVRCLALRRDAEQGPSAIPIRLRAGVHGSRDLSPARAAGFLRAPAPRGIRAGRWSAPARADAPRPQGGPVQAHARVGGQLLGGDGPLRRRHRECPPPPPRGDGGSRCRRRN